MNFVFFIGAIAPWLGLQMFVTDRARNRYRFLADRGIGTVAYYWSRTLPAIVFLVAASLLVNAYRRLTISASVRWLHSPWPV